MAGVPGRGGFQTILSTCHCFKVGFLISRMYYKQSFPLVIASRSDPCLSFKIINVFMSDPHLSFNSKNVFRYNIPYLLDKPGTGHQVILSIGLLYHDMLRCCYHLQSINDMFTMINVQMYNSMTTNTITILQVKGEVYLVDEPMLSQLDILEDHPTYYRSPQFSFDL